MIYNLLSTFRTHAVGTACKSYSVINSYSCEILRNKFVQLSDKWFKKKSNSVLYRSFYWTISLRNVKVEPLKMMLDTPQFHAMFNPEVKALADIFERHGYELRIAGGAVRDLLMHKQPHDIDFASTATPDQMKTMFNEEGIRMINSKGESHGTITARINDKENFEVTTLRIDVLTDGRRAKVEFTTDWHLDAGRRDLTINSLFLGLDGTVYDYFNGIEDLEKRRVRFVGDAVTRIREDYLRILRYFRFYGRIAQEAHSHDPEILKSISENANGLSGVSGERIWVELKKILTGNHKFSLMKTMLDTGIAPHIGLPGTPNVKELNALCERSSDLDLHPMTILSSLLKNESEMMTLLARLKFSSYDRELGFFILIHREDKPSEDPLQPYQILLLESTNKQSDTREWIEQVLSYRGEIKLLSEFKDWKTPKFPINGKHLIARGVSPGYRFNRILAAIKKRWISSSFTFSEEMLLENFDEIVQEVDEQYPNSKQKKMLRISKEQK